jgi:hypothetical protein
MRPSPKVSYGSPRLTRWLALGPAYKLPTVGNQTGPKPNFGRFELDVPFCSAPSFPRCQSSLADSIGVGRMARFNRCRSRG